MIPQPRAIIYLADPAAIKVRDYAVESNFTYLTCCLQVVTTSRARFPKPVYLYSPLSVFGPNIVASEGEEWKRYRTISAPAFSEVCPVLSSYHFLKAIPEKY